MTSLMARRSDSPLAYWPDLKRARMSPQPRRPNQLQYLPGLTPPVLTIRQTDCRPFHTQQYICTHPRTHMHIHAQNTYNAYTNIYISIHASYSPVVGLECTPADRDTYGNKAFEFSCPLVDTRRKHIQLDSVSHHADARVNGKWRDMLRCIVS